MADNITVTPGSGKTIAADDIGGALHQRIKMRHGEEGTSDGDVSRANGLPIAPAQTVAQPELLTQPYTFFTASYQDTTAEDIGVSTSVHIWNDTDANMLFNWDNGANPQFIIAARSAREVAILAGSSALYGKYASAPSTGNVYFEVRKG